MSSIQIPYSKAELDILNKIKQASLSLQLETYIIGGYVRDKILNRNNKDIDIVCDGDSIELAHAVSKLFKIPPRVNFFKNFGTAQIKLGNIEIEFVGARKESYNRDSRKPQVTPGTIKDDQLRRDFTINTLAIDIQHFDKDTVDIIDPFDGIIDIEDKIIKTPLDPLITFDDDPLRMLRAIRFATQLHFEVEDRIIHAIRQLKERMHIVSKERIVDELNKIMMCKKPSIGFKLLEKTGLLQLLLPQLTDLKGTQTKDNIGHKDNFIHSLQVLDNISQTTDNLWLRYAALLHDTGKAKVKKFDEKSGWTFHGHELVSGKLVSKIFANLKLPLHDKVAYVRKIVELHHRPISLTKQNITDSAIRRLLFDAGEVLDDLMTLCEADITSKNELKRIKYLANFKLVRERLKDVEERDQIRNCQPPISGELIMKSFNMPPGKDVGVIKDYIRENILDGNIPNEYNAAYDLMIEKGKELGYQINN